MNSFQPNAYITLLSVLIAGAIAVIIALALMLTGVGGTQLSITVEQSLASRFAADVCAEEALERIREDGNFSGSGILAVDAGSCQYNVIRLAGQTRTIQATGTAASSTRKVLIAVNQVLPSVTITSWQEVADFPQ